MLIFRDVDDMTIPHIYSCPICFRPLICEEKKTEATDYLTQGACQELSRAWGCDFSLDVAPLHGYRHLVTKSVPDQAIYQEFAFLIKPWKNVVICNNYINNTSRLLLKYENCETISFSNILVPDFPSLEKLKNKILTILTFS